MIQLNYGLLNELSAQYGDSFYIIDTQKLKKDIEDFKSSFSSRCRNSAVAYSFKTCFLSAVLGVVKACGCMAEVTSEFEYFLAEKMNFKDSEIIINGPFKDICISEKIIRGGGMVNIDSLYEAEKIVSRLDARGLSDAQAGVRCNFNVDGRPSRFGIDFESGDVEKAVRLLQSSGIKVACLHCHIKAATADSWKYKVERFLSLISEQKEKGNLPHLKYIDFGGGYHYGESALYAGLIANALNEYRLEDMTVLTEPGAAAVEGSMLFAAKIVNETVIRGRKYVTMAGCTEDVSAIRRRPPADVTAFGGHELKKGTVSVGGYTCMENDIICEVPYLLSAGDFVVFHNTGAYSSALRSNFIRSHPAVLTYDDGFSLSRRAGSLDFYFSSAGVGDNEKRS